MHYGRFAFSDDDRSGQTLQRKVTSSPLAQWSLLRSGAYERPQQRAKTIK
jgi:hypothetical protein